MGLDRTKRESRRVSRVLRGRDNRGVVVRGRRIRETPRFGALVQRNINSAGESKDAPRVRPHDGIPLQIPHRAHQPIPQLAKLASDPFRRVLDTQLLRRVEGVVEYRLRRGVVVVGMGGPEFLRDLDEVPELHAVPSFAVFGEAGLGPVQAALDDAGPTIVRQRCVVFNSTDGDGDDALCEKADVRILVVGAPIREEYKVHALEDGGIYGTECVVESALE